MEKKIEVGILMGSKSDWDKMKGALDALDRFGIGWEAKVLSAHRATNLVLEYVRSAKDRGLSVLICGAGGAAHLAGLAAANTTLPVIGVPVSSGALQGMDALLATVQMPRGIPVATVAINGSYNAGLLAAQICSMTRPELAREMETYKKELEDKVKNTELPKE